MSSGNSSIMAQVRLPENVRTGQRLHIQLPQYGRTKFQIVVPYGVRGGQTIKVNVPRPTQGLAAVQAHRAQRLAMPTVTPPRAPPQRRQTAHATPSGHSVADAEVDRSGGAVRRQSEAIRGNLTQPRPAPLWKGWFLKQQPHWPHQWQRRFGELVAVSVNGAPASDGRFGHELRYASSKEELLSGTRGSDRTGNGKNDVRSLPIGTKPMCPSGRLAIDAVHEHEGKLLLKLNTAQRDYALSITPAMEGVAFYRAVRHGVCGDLLDAVDRALGDGPGANLQHLLSEQQRLAAMGFDRFDCDAALCRCGGDGDAALQVLVASKESLKSPMAGWQPPEASGATSAARGGGGGGGGAAAAAAAAAADGAPARGSSSLSSKDNDVLDAIKNMGFTAEAAVMALAATGPNSSVEKATTWLMDNPTAGTSAAATSTSTTTTTTPSSSLAFSSQSTTARAAPRPDEYELQYGPGALGIEVMSNAEEPWVPKVMPWTGADHSSGESRHLGPGWHNRHLPRAGHLVVALRCAGDSEFQSLEQSSRSSSTGTSHFADELYNRLISCVKNGQRPITLRFRATDGIGPVESDSTSASSVPQHLPSNDAPPSVAEWEYMNDSGHFQRYGSTENATLSAAARDGRDMVEIVVGKRSYTVVLLKGAMIQINNDTGTQREVRRNQGVHVGEEAHLGPLIAPMPSLPRDSTEEEHPVPPLDDLTALLSTAKPIEEPAARGTLTRQDSDEVSQTLFASLLSTSSSDDFNTGSSGGGGDSSAGSDVAAVAVIDESHAECPVCFDALCSRNVALFYAGGRRVCQHYFHDDCAEDVAASGSPACPICSRPFEEFRVLPDPLVNGQKWFNMVDMDGQGALSRKEVVEALKAQLPVKSDELEKHFDELWKKWDSNSSGDLSYEELTRPTTGLFRYLEKAKQKTSSTSHVPALAATSAQPPPSLNDRQAWFTHFDADGNGSLDMQELIVAVQKSFPTVASNVDVPMTISVLMQACDLVKSGEVSEEEFIRPNGLADLMSASLNLT